MTFQHLVAKAVRGFRRPVELDLPRRQSGLAESSTARALAWVHNNHLPTGGIRVESRHPHAYPEVTGYLVPTLLAYGEQRLAVELVGWLLGIQRADGSFTDPDQGKKYIFDTGQVLRGLLAAIQRVPQAKQGARRAADYLLAQMVDGGAGGFPACYQGTDCPETVHLYVLPPLMEAGRRLDDAACCHAARRCLEFYVGHADFLRIDTLTHFLAYQLEALIDLGRADLARSMLDQVRHEQKADGSVRGAGGARWVCLPGLAQLAICWYKLGQDREEAAGRAIDWLEAHQRSEGGFRGSLGPGARYKPRVDVSWAVKFYLDACRLRTRAAAAHHASRLPAQLSADDESVRTVLARVGPGDHVLQADLGRGRILPLIQAAQPDVHCTAIDPLPESALPWPQGITRTAGLLEALPVKADRFDVVVSSQAMRFCVSPERAVSELIRAAKPGGWVLIIDRPHGRRNRPGRSAESQPPDSQRLTSQQLTALLRAGCDQVSAKPVDGPSEAERLVVWQGRKRSPLTGSQWDTVLRSADTEARIVDEIRFNRLSDWAKTIIMETSPGESVLEIGSGTAQISLQLAQAGRVVTCLDISQDSLDFAGRCAEQLHVAIDTVRCDAGGCLPFDDGAFDCVWSSGLLEHFSSRERRRLLRQWSRVCRGKLVNMVPNACCLAYLAGKMLQEGQGTWPYGLEMPLATLRDDCQAAGLVVLDEFTVGPWHALNFLPPEARGLRKCLAKLFAQVRPAELDDWIQGYLLVTVAAKGAEASEGSDCAE